MSRTASSLTSSYAGGHPSGAAGQSFTNQIEAKVVVLGAQNVGKTSLVHRYVHSKFLPENMTPSTVGASFLTTRVHDPETDSTIRLQIWDTAGQERFRSISKLYYRGAHAAVLCYDITSKRSFDEMGVWLRELKDKGGGGLDNQQTILHIVGTKSDIVAMDPSKREVPFERCVEFVAQELFPATTPTAASTRPGSSHGASNMPNAASATLATSSLHAGGVVAASSFSPHSNRSSVLLWGGGATGTQDHVWDCCHEISAKDGEGIDEVFRVITRKLVEQHQLQLDRQLASSTTPYSGDGLAGAAGGYFDFRHGHGNRLATPGGGPGGAAAAGAAVARGGSFRLGHGDKRRSWLGLGGGPVGSGLAATPGGYYGGVTAEEEARLRALEGRAGRCC